MSSGACSARVLTGVEVIVFHTLTPAEVEQIAARLLARLCARVQTLGYGCPCRAGRGGVAGENRV